MKRIIFVLVIILTLCSCGEKYALLKYQENDLCAVCEINGKYTVKIIKQGTQRRLEIVEPSALAYISFSKSDSGWSAVCSDTEIPISEDKISGIAALCSVFDMSEQTMTTAYDEDGVSVVDFETQSAVYRISYDSHAMPTHVTISTSDFTHEVEILSIEILN